MRHTCCQEEADLTHRWHAVIETVVADLIEGPMAHMPSGRFAAGATLRRQIVDVPARLARPQCRPACIYAGTGPELTGGWRPGTQWSGTPTARCSTAARSFTKSSHQLPTG
jgi:hypothetical protein